PPDALRLYRERIDLPARKRLDQARALLQPGRDARPVLRQITTDSFGSRATGPALDLLGDLAFERGRFAEAETWWRTLLASWAGGGGGAGDEAPDRLRRPLIPASPD